MVHLAGEEALLVPHYGACAATRAGAGVRGADDAASCQVSGGLPGGTRMMASSPRWPCLLFPAAGETDTAFVKQVKSCKVRRNSF